MCYDYRLNKTISPGKRSPLDVSNTQKNIIIIVIITLDQKKGNKKMSIVIILIEKNEPRY